MRNKYTVTLFMSDGSRPLFTCYAETPEAAVRKITEQNRPLAVQQHLTIDGGWAELLRKGEE